MKRDEYLDRQDVKDFIKWAAKLVSGKWRLAQSWSSNDPHGRNPRHFDCQTIYEAYEKYHWNRDSFKVMAARFDEFRRELKEATDANPVTDDDMDLFLETANYIVIWGGIRKLALPESRLNKLGKDALHTLKARSVLLEPECADTDNLRSFKYMNSGFTKIYSAMIDDFPIYDSRVGCALTSLIKQFCKERRYNGVPPLLSLGIPPGRKWRNPSSDPYQFSAAGYSKTHADSNLKAAWILGKLAKTAEGDFSKVGRERRVMALQAALFMIGYQPLGECAIRKA